MVFDQHGRKKSHRFFRALMRSAASLTYSQAQSAIDGRTDEVTGPLLDPVLRPLWGAYGSLARARAERGPLDLDLPERKILLDDEGRVRGVVSPPRLDAHRLIEEFMIAANVAAAETLEAKRTPLIYRVHDAPSKEKLAALGEFLATIGLKIPKSGTLKPAQFNRILAETRSSNVADLVSEVVLRSQAQAEYSPNNFGHFGLNLRRYAHFTSPIRRYADLIVHRALIRALDLGDGGLTDAEMDELAAIAEHISATERRAMLAERETSDRLIAAYLADRIGAKFPARVSGLTRTGLFVRLAETGADGFVPASSIGNEYYYHDEVRQALVGEETGLAYRLGDPVEVRLVEAIPSAGALRFEMLSEGRSIGAKPTPSAPWTEPRAAATGPWRPRQQAPLTGPGWASKSLTKNGCSSPGVSMPKIERTQRGLPAEPARARAPHPALAATRRAPEMPGLRRGRPVPSLSEGGRHLPRLRRGAASSPRRRRAALFHHAHRWPCGGEPRAPRRDDLPAAALGARGAVAALDRGARAVAAAMRQRRARRPAMGAAHARLRPGLQGGRDRRLRGSAQGALALTSPCQSSRVRSTFASVLSRTPWPSRSLRRSSS